MNLGNAASFLLGSLIGSPRSADELHVLVGWLVEDDSDLLSTVSEFVDRDKVRPKRDPGRCFLRAGFRHVGETRSGKVVLLLRPDEFPPADPPLGGEHPRGTIPLLPDFGLDEPVRTKRETFGGGLRRQT